MSNVYVYSDPHFGHKNMAIKRGFSSAEEMDELIVTMWNLTVNKKDTVWLLGDITMEKDNYAILDRLNGFKKVILGNHDQPQHVPSLLKHVNCVAGLYNYKRKFILSHAPIHEYEIGRFVKNIHGHVHENSITKNNELDERYFNVCAENINYTPILINSII